jgi:hypothetical protein
MVRTLRDVESLPEHRVQQLLSGLTRDDGDDTEAAAGEPAAAGAASTDGAVAG